MNDKQNDAITDNNSTKQANINQGSTIDPSFFRKTNKYKNLGEKNWLLRMFLLIPGCIVAIFFRSLLIQQSNPSSAVVISFFHFLMSFLGVLLFFAILNLFGKEKIKNIIYHSAVFSLILMTIQIFTNCSLILKPIH